MGSCGSGSPEGGIGPIVWVRRRNGSWWPGKILEAEEVSDSNNNLTSPRTGTPVKLLGREDASVDWYNLEKSKRVKAFRCGEFDDCIEKAEAAQGMPIKKREKYARREDAIIHALELEKQLLRKQGKLGVSDNLRRTPSESEMKEDELYRVANGMASESANARDTSSNQSLERTETNIKEEVATGLRDSLNTKNGSEPLRDDDNSEATPRMRGLRDFGLRPILKRKFSSSVESDSTSEKPFVEQFSQPPVNSAPSSDANGVEHIGPAFRSKSNRYFYLPPDTDDSLEVKGVMRNHFQASSLQFKDRNSRPLHGTHHGENSSSGLVEDSDSDSTDSDSDSSATEPDIDGDFTGSLISRHGERNAVRQLGGLAEHGTTSSEDLNESGNSIEVSHLYPDDPFLSSEAVSKWQLKGKRNIRPLKKSVHRSGENGFNKTLNGRYPQATGSMYGFDYDDLRERHFGPQTEWLGDVGNAYKSRLSFRGCPSMGPSPDLEDINWDDRGEPMSIGSSKYTPVFGGHHCFNVRKMPLLLDVDLKVQAGYQKEPVPIVSLTSKLNGRSIIGYPVHIKVLEEGSTDALGSLNDDYSGVDHEGNLTLPSAWKTARRTNLRVPRPHLSSVLGGDDSTEDFPFAGQDRLVMKLSPGGPSYKTSPGKGNLQNTRSSEKNAHKKLPKKGSLSSNQKIRTLSSIAIQQNFGKAVYEAGGSKLGGVLKPEISVPTTVACIPVKLAFSRLLEKINRPPSKPHGKVLASDGDAGSKIT